jgi:hypothetical protein
MDYFIESSAKTGFNTEKIFVDAAKLLYKEYNFLENKQNFVKNDENKKLKKTPKNAKKKKVCC